MRGKKVSSPQRQFTPARTPPKRLGRLGALLTTGAACACVTLAVTALAVSSPTSEQRVTDTPAILGALQPADQATSAERLALQATVAVLGTSLAQTSRALTEVGPAPTPLPLPAPPTLAATDPPPIASTARPSETAIPPPTLTLAGEDVGLVTRVIDGDTIDVDIAGQSFRVRYIGINAPESNQPCYSEAANANAALVAGREVRLVKDISETDRFGRLLRYVYLGEVFINAELVRRGFAQAVEYPPDIGLAAQLRALDQDARALGLNCHATGVFGDGAGNAPTATQVIRAPTLPLPTPPPPATNCHPSYPDICIPPPPPDLDCGEIQFRRFRVLPPDPHRFDGDKDGIGCESG